MLNVDVIPTSIATVAQVHLIAGPSSNNSGMLDSIVNTHLPACSQSIVVAEPSVQPSEDELLEARGSKKIVNKHSQYPLSPFALVFGHEAVQRSKKVVMYLWLTQPGMPHQTLAKHWVHHLEPWPISICGYVLRSCFVQSGSFNIDLRDVIMRLWTYLDRRMYEYYVKYGKIHKPWRHFLPATFVVFFPFSCVITQQDYLQSDKVRDRFIVNQSHPLQS